VIYILSKSTTWIVTFITWINVRIEYLLLILWCFNELYYFFSYIFANIDIVTIRFIDRIISPVNCHHISRKLMKFYLYMFIVLYSNYIKINIWILRKIEFIIPNIHNGDGLFELVDYSISIYIQYHCQWQTREIYIFPFVCI
jgi:hypothetical protein